MGHYKELKLYQVSEEELAKLEKGPGASFLLNLLIFFVGIVCSFIIALCTSQMSDAVKHTFISIVVVGVLIGIVLLVFWLREKKEIPALVKNIRARLTEYTDGIQEKIPEKTQGAIFYQSYRAISAAPNIPHLRVMAEEFGFKYHEILSQSNKSAYWEHLQRYVEGEQQS